MLPLVGALHVLLELAELECRGDQVLLVPVLNVVLLELVGQFLAHLAHTDKLLQFLAVFCAVSIVLVRVVSLQSD